MRVVTKSLILLLVGAAAGVVVTLLIAPNIITWYQTTSDPNAMCNCVTTAHNTVRTLVQAQAIGGAVGPTPFLIPGRLIFPPPPPPPGPPPEAPPPPPRPPQPTPLPFPWQTVVRRP